MQHLLRFLTLTLGLAALALAGGCEREVAHPPAEPFIARHYRTLRAGNYDAVLAEYAPSFFAKTKREQWLAKLKDLVTQGGPYQRHSVIGLSQFQQKGEQGVGSYVNVVCRTTYGKRQVQERFTLFKATADPDFKIVRHFIEEPPKGDATHDHAPAPTEN